MQYYGATLKNDAILQRALKNDAILRATLKNDAILRRDTKKRCNITSARSQVRGHKNTQISHYLGGVVIIDAKSMHIDAQS
jgi:hypothetical protein